MREPQKAAPGLQEQHPPLTTAGGRRRGRFGYGESSGLRPKVQSRGPSFPLQTPLSGPWALGLGTSLRSVKPEEECSKSSLQKINSEVINAPASQQRLPSTAPSPCAPLGPSSRLRLAVSRPGVLHRDTQSPWKKQRARSSPGPAGSGWETLLVPLRLQEPAPRPAPGGPSGPAGQERAWAGHPARGRWPGPGHGPASARPWRRPQAAAPSAEPHGSRSPPGPRSGSGHTGGL